MNEVEALNVIAEYTVMCGRSLAAIAVAIWLGAASSSVTINNKDTNGNA